MNHSLLPRTGTCIAALAACLPDSTGTEQVTAAEQVSAAEQGVVVKPPCVAEMPAFEEVHQAMAGSVSFVGKAVADSGEAARELAAQIGVTYSLGDDPDSEVLRDLAGFVLPTTVLLNRQGEIAFGPLTGKDLQILIDKHIEPGSL